MGRSIWDCDIVVTPPQLEDSKTKQPLTVAESSMLAFEQSPNHMGAKKVRICTTEDFSDEVTPIPAKPLGERYRKALLSPEIQT